MPTGEHTKNPIWRAAQSERLKGNDCGHGKLKDPRVYEGKEFGVFKVVRYVKQRMPNKENKTRDYYYEVECAMCGTMREMTLNALQVCKTNTAKGRKNLTCKHCESVLDAKRKLVAKGTPAREKLTDCFIRSDKANVNNLSTGIKHMTTKRNRGGTVQYMVYVGFDRKQTVLLRSVNFAEAKAFADELNEVLKEGGKEAFYDWYKGKM